MTLTKDPFQQFTRVLIYFKTGEDKICLLVKSKSNPDFHLPEYTLELETNISPELETNLLNKVGDLIENEFGIGQRETLSMKVDEETYEKVYVQIDEDLTIALSNEYLDFSWGAEKEVTKEVKQSSKNLK
jgi:hypothetical protein